MTDIFDGPRGSIPGSTETIGSSEVTSPGTSSDPSTKDTAKEQARSVAQEGVQGGKHLASVAADQAKEVVAEAGDQAQGLLAEAKSELLAQAATQKDRVANQLHTLAQEFGSMASKSDQDGLASALAEQASRQTGTVSHWLAEREPGSLMGELKDFARAKPGTFLAVAAGIGLVAGRMTRGVQAGPIDQQVPLARPAQPGMAAAPGMVPETPSAERVPDQTVSDPTVGVGALYPDMVSDEPLPSRAPGIAR